MGSGAFLVEVCRQLGDELVRAWHVHHCVPKLPPDEDEVLHARRVIAQRCLYGVDKNPMAVDLAKLSLWLATLAKDHPFTFLDHTFRCGDSLVGLTRQQIAGFHWQPGKQKEFERAIIETRIQRAAEFRQKILESRDDVPYAHLQQQLALADESLDFVRLVGDLVVSAFFAADKDKERQERVDELFIQFSTWLSHGMRADEREPLAAAIAELRGGEKPLEPFHFEIEFPEVFALDVNEKVNGRFDFIVGNPPFMAGRNVWPNLGGSYRDILQTLYPQTGGKAVDLVAHFFRRTFGLIREGGTFGLVATNTISQGDTRDAGLRFICTHGGTVYSARRRMRWPGAAAVVVSVVHVRKGSFSGIRVLDSRQVLTINAYLFSAGGDANPVQLRANMSKSFRGHVVLGMGFTFDDSDHEGIASPLSEMERLIAMNNRNAERIFPYIGGLEINTSPTQSHHRYVINFEDMTETQASEWPDLMHIVRERVLPERAKLGGYSVAEKRSEKWWQFGTYAAALQSAIADIPQCLVLSQVSSHHSIAFQPTSRIFVQTVVVFPFDSTSAFAVLQCRTHEVWARYFGSSMKDDLRYTPSDCFDTFAFPPDWTNDDRLKAFGCEYYAFRADLMVRNNEGLTKTYNRFHDPDERSDDILKLRELHAAMDRAVLEAYGWHDLAERATCEFLLDYEDDEEDEDELPTKGKGKKKPWRYRWPDDFRDEVLARLLDLNQQRAAQERLAGLSADAATKKKSTVKAKGAAPKKGSAKKAARNQKGLPNV
jgi:hypothetical protein